MLLFDTYLKPRVIPNLFGHPFTEFDTFLCVLYIWKSFKNILHYFFMLIYARGGSRSNVILKSFPCHMERKFSLEMSMKCGCMMLQISIKAAEHCHMAWKYTLAYLIPERLTCFLYRDGILWFPCYWYGCR